MRELLVGVQGESRAQEERTVEVSRLRDASELFAPPARNHERRRLIGLCSAAERHFLFIRMDRMAEGVIKRLTDKGFGFIDTGSGKDLFFHMSGVEGARFEDLKEGQRVSFTEGQGPKGPRAEKVKPL